MADLFKTKPFYLTSLDKYALDPANGLQDDIATWAKLYFDIDVFPWQQYFYHRPVKDKCVVSGIRTGKSFGVAIWFLHHGFYHPEHGLLNTSISSEQAKIVFTNMYGLAQSNRFKHWVTNIQKSPYPRIELANGVSYDFRSLGYNGDLLRGFEWDVINLDEAGYVSSQLAIDTIRGRLLGANPKTRKPRAGVFWQVSSPKGKNGPLFERWKKGDPRYHEANTDKYLSLRVKTTDNPMLDKETLRDIMAGYTERMIRQELFGEFLDDNGAEFSRDQVTWCCSETHDEVQQLLRDIAKWREKRGNKSFKAELGIAEDLEYFELEPKPGRQYIASWDLGKKATKAGRNATVGMVWDVTELPWRMVAFRYETNSSYLAAMGWIEEWQIKYSAKGNQAITVIDATGKGDVLNEVIEAENRIQVEGIVYSNQLKPNLITSGKLAIERDMVRFPPILRMIDQISGYTQYDKDIAQDIVMAFCQAMHRARDLTGVSTARPLSVSHLYRRSGIGSSSLTQRYAERRRGSMRLRTGRNAR